MKRSAVEIYALSVCLLALIGGGFAVALGLFDVVRIAAPGFTMKAWDWERYKSDESYLDSLRGRGDRQVDLSPEELTRRRLVGLERALRTERRRGLQSLARVGIVLLVVGAAFRLHWRFARRLGTGAGR